MLLKIDYREHFFIKLLQELFKQDFQNNIVYTVETLNFIILNLEIGDYIISENNDLDSLKIIIERKSIKDLCSSITDLRFKEQKKRLLESIKDPSKIVYLIEGRKINTPININASIQNLIFKHNYKVLFSENEKDTFDNILLLYKKFNNKDFDTNTQQECISLIKRKDKINDNIFAYQLNTIHGVSMKIALELSNIFKNMNNLIIKYNELNEILDKELMLYNICKIGKALSKKIYKALH